MKKERKEVPRIVIKILVGLVRAFYVTVVGAGCVVTYYLFRQADSDIVRQLYLLMFLPAFVGLTIKLIELHRSIWNVLGIIAGGVILGGIIWNQLYQDAFYLGKPLPFGLWAVALLLAIVFIACSIEITRRHNRLMLQLSEGLLAVQSLAFIYIAIEYRWLWSHVPLVRALTIVGVLVAISAIWYMLGQYRWHRRVSLLYNHWSVIVVFILSCFYVAGIMHLYATTEIVSGWGAVALAVQFFLFGVVASNIYNNFQLLASYFPDRDWKENVQTAHRHMLKRFERKQADSKVASFVLVAIALFFAANAYLHFVLPSSAVWLAIFVTPLLVRIATKIVR